MKLEHLLKKYLDDFDKTLDEQNIDFAGKRKDLEHSVEKLTNEKDAELSQCDARFGNQHAELKLKCEYLKAEVARYKTLLEDFYKRESGPELVSRVAEMKNAIEEYAASKIAAQTDQYRENRAQIEAGFLKSLNELKVKIDLLKEEKEALFTQLTERLDEFLRNEVESFKNTASQHRLVDFDTGSFQHVNASLRLGDRLQIISDGMSEHEIRFPVVLDFQDTCNLAIIYDEKSKQRAEDITDGTIFRMLSSHLPDKCRLFIFDTQMFEKFSEFLKLPSKVLSKGFKFEVLLDQIDKLENEVREKLGLIWSDIQESNQSIHEYNVKKIKSENYDEVIPYRLFVLDNLQSLPERSDMESVFDRMSNLTRYGSNFVLLFNLAKAENGKWLEAVNKLPETGFHIIDLTGKAHPSLYSTPRFLTANLANEDKKELLDRFISEFNDVERNRIKLKFIQTYEKDKAKWFSGRVAAKVEVPIGKSLNRDGLEYLYFTTKEGLSNALLCGGVGSGKTNFLKSIITSLSLQYSPNELELYLIDMKNGAGFSIFESMRLPHVKLFAFSAENELIHDIFANLKSEMDARYAEYAKYNIDNLEDVYKNPQLASFAPKRTVVIIDEFASIFTDDGLYLDEISQNILNLVQKGRGMGINLLLATQNFNNIKQPAFSQAITQIPTRILLKSSPDAAMSILPFSNSGYKEVTRVGEGFINYNFGEQNVEGGNHFFRSYLLDNEDLSPILRDIADSVVQRGLQHAQNIFIDSSRQAVFEANNVMKEWHAKIGLEESFRKHGVPCWIGESFLMKKENHFSFEWKINSKSYGQNILISGNERNQSFQSIFSILSSLSHTVPNGRYAVKWLDPFEEDISSELGMAAVCSQLPHKNSELFHLQDLEYVIRQLEAALDARKNNTDRDPIITVLPALEKYFQLHSEYGDSEWGKRLKDLLATGSSYGIYFICEVNRPSSLNRISRDLIGNFEHRISYFLNAEESDYFINSKMAGKLIDPDMPNVRSKAIYYSQSNQNWVKFKSYVNVHQQSGLFHEAISVPDGYLRLDSFNQVIDDIESSNVQIEDNPWKQFDAVTLGDDETATLQQDDPILGNNKV